MYPGITKASLTVLAVPTDFLNLPQNQKLGFLLATILLLPRSPELALAPGEDAPLLLVLPYTCPGYVLPAEDEVGKQSCMAGFAPKAGGDAYGPFQLELFCDAMCWCYVIVPVAASSLLLDQKWGLACQLCCSSISLP